MKKIFYFYSNNVKGLPKGLMFLIILFMLLLIPVLLSLAIIGGAVALTASVITNLLPFKKKQIKTSSSSSEPITIDITPRENFIK